MDDIGQKSSVHNNQTESQHKRVEDANSFYAICVLNSGYDNFEPLHISIARYDNGIFRSGFSQYYLPEKEI